jgi:hypothetical protein
MAFLAPVLLTFLVGLWEVGRYIMIQNVIDSSAREGARLAASGSFLSSNNTTLPAAPHAGFTLPPPSSNTNFELDDRVLLWLKAAGYPTTGATVTVTNSTQNWSYTWNETGANPTTGSGSGSGYDPSACANQLDFLVVTVTLPYKNVGWSPLGLFIGNSVTMTATATWLSVRDLPLNVTTNIPTKPLGSTDPLP